MSDIKNDGMYSIDEMVIEKLTPLSSRYIQRYAKKVGIKKIDNGYKFFGFQIIEMNDEYFKIASERTRLAGFLQ